MDHRTLNELARELQVGLRGLDLPAQVEPGRVLDHSRGELIVDLDGRSIRTQVISRSDLRPVHADEVPRLDDADAGIVFADRIADRSREVLRQRGWGWLDRRRGRLRLWATGVRVDALVPPTLAPEVTAGAANPFTPAGRQLALWLLTHPDEHASPRALHRELGISASQISNLLAALSAEALLRKDRRPLVPELFWALAEHWRPVRHPIVSLPGPAELAASPELGVDRWVATDTAAALAYGAPVVASADYPVDLYLPTERSLSWLLGRSVRAAEPGQRSATVAVAPSPLVCDSRLRRDGSPWPLAHPVVVALDLAVDRGRGREVLEGWDPAADLGVTRVW